MKNYFFKYLLAFFILFIPFIFTSCVKTPDIPAFKSSKSLPKYDQENFDLYLSDTKKWLLENRNFITENKNQELDLVMPFELKPNNSSSKKAILLVHGLTDSPAYYKDISKVFTNNGFLVRTILLPGHISKPADLMLPSLKDWENVVKHHINLLKKENYEIWLGGFSTGANLVTSYAIDDKSIKGLYLFSPGFYSKSKVIVFSPFVSYFMDWLDIDEENNILKYESMPMNEVNLYYKTTLKVQEKFQNKVFDRPAFFVFSKDDSVIDYEKTVEIFQKKFTNEKSKFILYANINETKEEMKNLLDNKRFKVYNSYLPEKRISNFSHLSVMFSKDNAYYGENGNYIMLNNGQKDKKFISRNKTCFSSWGYNVDGLYHARLTWNPYFNELKNDINEFLKDE